MIKAEFEKPAGVVVTMQLVALYHMRSVPAAAP
jgi:hypothetical protein